MTRPLQPVLTWDWHSIRRVCRPADAQFSHAGCRDVGAGVSVLEGKEDAALSPPQRQSARPWLGCACARTTLADSRCPPPHSCCSPRGRGQAPIPVLTDALRGLRCRVGVSQRQAGPLRFGESIRREAVKGFTPSVLLEACGRDVVGLRDAALLSLGYDAGLRVSELDGVTGWLTPAGFERPVVIPHNDGVAESG